VFFVASAAAAEMLGFRPCLKCRPETAPGSPAWRGTATTVARALRLIDDGVLDEHTVEHLASRLGVGARHLERLFVRHLGATRRASRSRDALTPHVGSSPTRRDLSARSRSWRASGVCIASTMRFESSIDEHRRAFAASDHRVSEGDIEMQGGVLTSRSPAFQRTIGKEHANEITRAAIIELARKDRQRWAFTRFPE
jgi:AraC-like DNA-binding protein